MSGPVVGKNTEYPYISSFPTGHYHREEVLYGILSVITTVLNSLKIISLGWEAGIAKNFKLGDGLKCRVGI